MAIFSIVVVKLLSHYRLHLRYPDGTKGDVVVLHLTGRGIFEAWEAFGAFESVQNGDDGDLVRSDDADLCAETFYLELTGRAPEDVFPGQRETASHP